MDRIAYAIRKHWPIETQLHWRLDVIFDEDASKARKGHPPLNLHVLRKAALVWCKSAGMGKRVSLQKKRFRAALDPTAFLSILFGSFQLLLPRRLLFSLADALRMCYDEDAKELRRRRGGNKGRSL